MSVASPHGAEAGYFGPPDAPLFGWLHSAASADTGLALLVCNPFGFEEVCAHRSLRDLARAAAASGVPTLRFDYAACGNSAGDIGSDVDLVALWQASIGQAIDEIKRATGAMQVCLLGVRLGAMLAALAALRREDVAGLIAIAPVVRGRAYLRELTVLGRTGRAAAPGGDASLGLESAGFVLPKATCDALSPLDLHALPRAPAPRVLVVERDDLPDSGDWVSALQRLGAATELARWPGYAAMIDDPQRARTPQRIVEGVVEVLARWQQGLPRAKAAATSGSGRRELAGEGATEQPVHIDVGGSSLFGVMHRPTSARPGPAVLMLNSGSVHSIGPNRLWVRLARLWAASGLRVLRLDIAGIGDSDPRAGEPDNVVYSPHAMADVAAALAWLRDREGASACHAMGLCSGAYHAFKAATSGLPVASALMINPLTYSWEPGTPLSDVKEYEVVELSDKYLSRLLTLDPWVRLLRGELHLSLIAHVAWRRLLGALRLGWRGVARALRLPLKDDLARELRRAARARVRLHFVFAAGAAGHTLLQQQSGRILGRLIAHGYASIDFVPDADHTFTSMQARERLVGLVDRLIRRACAVGGPG